MLSLGSMRIVASHRPILGYSSDIFAGGLLADVGAASFESWILSSGFAVGMPTQNGSNKEIIIIVNLFIATLIILDTEGNCSQSDGRCFRLTTPLSPKSAADAT